MGLIIMNRNLVLCLLLLSHESLSSELLDGFEKKVYGTQFQSV